jgi:single-strand DNA-binding protein
LASVNKVIRIGKVDGHPEARSLRDGNSVCQLVVITSESWRDKVTGIQNNRTERHCVQLYRQQADVAQRYLDLGSDVYIEGKIRTRSWQDDQGQTRYITEIEAQNMTMLGSKPSVSRTINTSNVATGPTKLGPLVASVTPEKDPWEDAPEDEDPFPF